MRELLVLPATTSRTYRRHHVVVTRVVGAVLVLEIIAVKVFARGAALRFFLTRMVDWTSTPEGALVKPKNPLEYAGRLAFHRKVETAEGYGA